MPMELLRQHALEFATIAIAVILAGSGLVLWRLRQRLLRSEQERRRAAEELNRRLSELFSLQELSYVLSDSLELDRIVEQVVRYAVRFLDAQGALLALLEDAPSDPLQIAAAEGTLAPLRGQKIQGDDPGLVARSTGREHLELIRNSGPEATVIVKGFEAAAAAAVPLRSHGIVIGTLIITDPREGVFVPEDIRLLSTLATHAAVVIANARFFEMVRRAKDQWETAFDALSEGIAVVDDEGRVRRSNRALADLLNTPLQNVVGTPLGEALLGKTSALQELLAARRPSRPAGGALRATAARGPRQRRPHSGRSDRTEHRRDGRGRHGAAGPRNAARSEREAGGRRPARLRRRSRAQQSADIDRGAVGVPARAEGARQEGPRPFAGDSRAGGAREPHRAQSPHLRAQRCRRARAGGPERRDSADAVSDVVRPEAQRHPGG